VLKAPRIDAEINVTLPCQNIGDRHAKPVLEMNLIGQYAPGENTPTSANGTITMNIPDSPEEAPEDYDFDAARKPTPTSVVTLDASVLLWGDNIPVSDRPDGTMMEFAASLQSDGNLSIAGVQLRSLLVTGRFYSSNIEDIYEVEEKSIAASESVADGSNADEEAGDDNLAAAQEDVSDEVDAVQSALDETADNDNAAMTSRRHLLDQLGHRLVNPRLWAHHMPKTKSVAQMCRVTDTGNVCGSSPGVSSLGKATNDIGNGTTDIDTRVVGHGDGGVQGDAFSFDFDGANVEINFLAEASVSLSASEVSKMTEGQSGAMDASIRALWAGNLTRIVGEVWKFEHKVSLVATLSITAGPVTANLRATGTAGATMCLEDEPWWTLGGDVEVNMEHFNMRLTVNGRYDCHNRAVEIVTVLSNFKLGSDKIALIIPSATLSLNISYPDPGCDCDNESVEELAARLGSPALGGEKTPPHWTLWVTGTIALGSGSPNMPRFDGISVTLTTIATGIGADFEIGKIYVRAEVQTHVGDKKQITVGGAVDFEYPCETYVEARMWLTVDPDTTGLSIGGNGTGGAADAFVRVKCDPPAGATWAFQEGTVLLEVTATANSLAIGDTLVLEEVYIHVVKSVAPGGSAFWEFVVNATGSVKDVHWFAEVEGSYDSALTNWRSALELTANAGLTYESNTFNLSATGGFVIGPCPPSNKRASLQATVSTSGKLEMQVNGSAQLLCDPEPSEGEVVDAYAPPPYVVIARLHAPTISLIGTNTLTAKNLQFDATISIPRIDGANITFDATASGSAELSGGAIPGLDSLDMKGSAMFDASFRANAAGEVMLNWILVNATVRMVYYSDPQSDRETVDPTVNPT
jgi:hypothetical protein